MCNEVTVDFACRITTVKVQSMSFSVVGCVLFVIDVTHGQTWTTSSEYGLDDVSSTYEITVSLAQTCFYPHAYLEARTLYGDAHNWATDNEGLTFAWTNGDTGEVRNSSVNDVLTTDPDHTVGASWKGFWDNYVILNGFDVSDLFSSTNAFSSSISVYIATASDWREDMFYGYLILTCNQFTPSPTDNPTDNPSGRPTNNVNPTDRLTNRPTDNPSLLPTPDPTKMPIDLGNPTQSPTYKPTTMPTDPTTFPTYPSNSPTNRPTFDPSIKPTIMATNYPSQSPSHYPSRYTSEDNTNDDQNSDWQTSIWQQQWSIALFTGVPLLICIVLLVGYIVWQKRKMEEQNKNGPFGTNWRQSLPRIKTREKVNSLSPRPGNKQYNSTVVTSGNTSGNYGEEGEKVKQIVDNIEQDDENSKTKSHESLYQEENGNDICDGDGDKEIGATMGNSVAIDARVRTTNINDEIHANDNDNNDDCDDDKDVDVEALHSNDKNIKKTDLGQVEGFEIDTPGDQVFQD